MPLLHNIQAFIDARIREHPQLMDGPLSVWTPDHETQINIDPSGLEPSGLGEKPTRWLTPDGDVIGHIRIPFGAYTDSPSFNDRRPNGAEHHYWAYIGTSGWNWKVQKSMWVGVDFDSATNHDGGLPAEQLEEIKLRAMALPYVRVRTSKSGLGTHLIIPLDPWITTRTHGEHAALAKDVLARISQGCGFDFRAGADCSGLILWHWQRGLTENGCKFIT